MDALAAEEAAIEAEMAEFDETTRRTIDTAVRIYEGWLFTEDAFPASEQANAWAAFVLRRAFRLGQEELADTTHVQLLRRRGHMALEHWKNELRPLVIDKYHLDPLAEQAAQSAVVTDLLQNSAFLHLGGKKYRAPIIQDAFGTLHQRVLSESKPDMADTDTATMHAFSPTISLVATALECCLSEWKSGQRVDLPFNAESYKGRYTEHLANIRPLAGSQEGRWTF
ncbi:hypothetical protein C8J56DRAFT_162139 [Mycena floridula]|nr:hypothetical protein C8J56DRAFT_162139 [Mycena floridula]